MKNTILFLLTVLTVSVVQGQYKDFTLEWKNQKNLSAEEDGILYVPGFSDEHFDFLIGEEKILFSAQWQGMGNIASYNLTQVVYEPIQKRHLTNLNLDNIPNHPESELKSDRKTVV